MNAHKGRQKESPKDEFDMFSGIMQGLNEALIIVRDGKTTEQLFEELYGKPFPKITAEDMGPGKELDRGEDEELE